MKQKTMCGLSAFTFIELLIVITVLAAVAALATLFFSATTRVTGSTPRISCMDNFKEIGTAYRLWAGDNGDRTPAEQTVANGLNST
jgi:prepilin-type N-terminal cleavage/methylation domain-containing protein